MYAQFASKITAFTVAVMLNSLMVLGVGYLFSEQPQARAEATAGCGHSYILGNPILRVQRTHFVRAMLPAIDDHLTMKADHRLTARA
jgi:hypothetical protein